jgi:hypothetical protein
MQSLLQQEVQEEPPRREVQEVPDMRAAVQGQSLTVMAVAAEEVLQHLPMMEQ